MWRFAISSEASRLQIAHSQQQKSGVRFAFGLKDKFKLPGSRKVPGRNHPAVERELSSGNSANKVLVLLPIKFSQRHDLAKLLASALEKGSEDEFRTVDLIFIELVLDIVGSPLIGSALWQQIAGSFASRAPLADRRRSFGFFLAGSTKPKVSPSQDRSPQEPSRNRLAW